MTDGDGTLIKKDAPSGLAYNSTYEMVNCPNDEDKLPETSHDERIAALEVAIHNLVYDLELLRSQIADEFARLKHQKDSPRAR